MKNNEEIFDQFRKNEHKLDAAPTPMAWDRLEQKLDSKNTTKRKVLWNYYAAAAGFLLLALMGIFYLFQDNNQLHTTTTIAQADKSDAPNSSIVQQEEAKPARPILMSHREKQYYYGNQPIAANIPKKNNVNKSPINQTQSATVEEVEESVLDDKLIALNTDKYNQSVPSDKSVPTNIPKSKSKIDPVPSKPMRKAPLVEVMIEDNTDAEGMVKKEQMAPSLEQYSKTSSMPAVEETSPQVSAELSDNLAEEVEESIARDEKPMVLDQVETTTVEKKVERKRRKSEAYPSNQPMMTAASEAEDIVDPEPPNLKDIALGNSVSAMPKASSSNDDAASSQNNYQINQLNWISGSWIDYNLNTKEVWENISANQLIGTVYSYENNNEPYESDRIQIKRSRGKIILIQQNEVFDLIEINGKKAIFRSQVDNKTLVKIFQSGNKLKISKLKSNKTETKVLRKE